MTRVKSDTGGSGPPAPKLGAIVSAGKNPRAGRRRRTSHLKDVPADRQLREEIRSHCNRVADGLDKSQPLGKDEVEAIARRLLDEMSLPEGYLGWTMVVLASAFWRDQVAAVPPERRLLLLPHCLKHAEGCPADYDEFGLDCERCGACSIADFRTDAEKMGYRVLVAEGSPIVLKIIISGYVDAIVGVACLNVLEKAIDKILLAGIPCMATPLLSSDCRNTSVDEDWVNEMIHVRRTQPTEKTRTYLHLMRAASRMFDPEELERLAPRIRGASPATARKKNSKNAENKPRPDALEPISATESIAFDFLRRGGKHTRPFITLAAYDALRGAKATTAEGQAHAAELPTAVRRTALAIETFHKASLVHDDIEDDDFFRYGSETIHRQYGVPTAINVGDYLIGLGYRLVSREAAALGTDVAADLLDHLADAHMRLSEGQGAELIWRDALNKTLSPLDALKIYALKTAPAFEVALYAGVRLAGDAVRYAEPIKQLSKHVGVAFQILNDLKDWQQDNDNKLRSVSDVLGGRPTVLWALACESLDEVDRARLERLVSDRPLDGRTLAEVRRLYTKADVFEKAHRLVDKYQQRAEAVADDLPSDELRRLLYYVIDNVLERPAENAPELVLPTAPLPITALSPK